MVYRFLNSGMDTGCTRDRFASSVFSIIAALAADPLLDGVNISVTVLGNYVSLDGVVAPIVAERAEQIAAAIVGEDYVLDRMIRSFL